MITNCKNYKFYKKVTKDYISVIYDDNNDKQEIRIYKNSDCLFIDEDIHIMDYNLIQKNEFVNILRHYKQIMLFDKYNMINKLYNQLSKSELISIYDSLYKKFNIKKLKEDIEYIDDFNNHHTLYFDEFIESGFLPEEEFFIQLKEEMYENYLNKNCI